MRCVVALDQGTTSSRAIVFDQSGVARAVAQQELPQSFPREGWVEHDPNLIWQTQIEVARAALAQAGIEPGAVVAIGITNQRETTVVWDRASGEPLHPAIVWQDRRTAPECARLRAAGAESLCRERTGLLLDPYFSATKVSWILDHVAGARERAERGELAFGTVDAWLVHRLTAGRVHVTDETNAARTLLYDIRARRWDDELLALFRVPRAMLPRVAPSSGIVADTERDLFGASIPIAGIAGDQQAALFGQRCVAPGMVKNTYGTGCFALMHAGTQCVASRHRLLTTLACGEGEEARYALEGSVFIAGALVQWLRDGLGIIAAASEIEPLAASVPDSAGVVVVPALAGLGAPHWDPDARGSMHGLTRGTTRAHVARAALEAIALASADLVDAMRLDAGVQLAGMRVDGGAARNDLLMQIQADVLQAPVVRPRVTETTALGAAYLAGLATGFWSDAAELASQWQVDRTFEPRMPPGALAALRSRWSRAIERSKAWAVDEAR